MTLAEIERQIEEYFNLEKNAFIDEHLNLIDLIENIFVTKRSLKHVVEQRKKDGYEKIKTTELFTELYEIISKKDFILVPNKHSSQLLIENNVNKNVLIVAVIEENQGKSVIVTAFYRSTKKLKKYFKNKKP